MRLQSKARLVCMHCLNSKIVDKQDSDPETARLIIMWSCDNCAEDCNDVKYYDNQMREIDINENTDDMTKMDNVSYVSRAKAQSAFCDGKKIRHRQFFDGEFVQLNEDNRMVDENGTILNKADFWLSTEAEDFDNGWIILD